MEIGVVSTNLYCSITFSLNIFILHRLRNKFLQLILISLDSAILCGVRGREVERQPRNHEVPSSSPGRGSQLWDFSLARTFRREYWCSSQEAESA